MAYTSSLPRRETPKTPLSLLPERCFNLLADVVHGKALLKCNRMMTIKSSHFQSNLFHFLNVLYLVNFCPQNLYWIRFRKQLLPHFFQTTPCLCCCLCYLQLFSQHFQLDDKQEVYKVTSSRVKTPSKFWAAKEFGQITKPKANSSNSEVCLLPASRLHVNRIKEESNDLKWETTLSIGLKKIQCNLIEHFATGMYVSFK